MVVVSGRYSIVFGYIHRFAAIAHNITYAPFIGIFFGRPYGYLWCSSAKILVVGQRHRRSFRSELYRLPRRLIACTTYGSDICIIMSLWCERRSAVRGSRYVYGGSGIELSHSKRSLRYHHCPRCLATACRPRNVGTRCSYIVYSNILYISARERVYHTQSVVFYGSQIVHIAWNGFSRTVCYAHYPHPIVAVGSGDGY